jgi:hypothetical protein
MKTHLRFDAPFLALLLGSSLLVASAALLGAAARTIHLL